MSKKGWYGILSGGRYIKDRLHARLYEIAAAAGEYVVKSWRGDPPAGVRVLTAAGEIDQESRQARPKLLKPVSTGVRGRPNNRQASSNCGQLERIGDLGSSAGDVQKVP